MDIEFRSLLESIGITDLDDVDISSVADKNLLQYDSATSNWVNISDLDLGAGTITAEQITSTDDLNLSGLLTNTLSASDNKGLIIDGATNPYTGTSSLQLIDVDIKVETAASSDEISAYGMDFKTENNHVLSGSGLFARQTSTGITNTVNLYADHTATPSIIFAEYGYGIKNIVLADREITGGCSNSSREELCGIRNEVTSRTGFNNADKKLDIDIYGLYNQIRADSVYRTAGTLNVDVYGIYNTIYGSTGGDTNTTYGVYVRFSIYGDVSYAFYNAGSNVDYAFYSKGGDVELTDGNLATTGDIYLQDDGATLKIGSSQDLTVGFNGNYGYIDVSGDSLYIGDNTTNALEIKPDGEIILHGTARVTKDLWIDASGIKAPGSKPATEISHGALETSAWQFSDENVEANQQSVSWRIAPPYDMDRSEGVKIRLGWSSNSTGNVKWQLEYRWLEEDEDTTLGAEETLTVVDSASATSDGLVITDITGIDAPSSNDASIIFRLKRLSADAQDTITDTVELHGVCFNYTSNKLGEGLT